ncbi:hypothetical protein ACE6H2_015962 [Prunus campanulata]
MGQAERDTDTKMFEHVIDIIHDDLLPKELEFFCRILHNDVAKVHPVTEKQMMYEVKFVISKWMVDGHPIHFLICVRNCVEHGTHMESEAWFDLLMMRVINHLLSPRKWSKQISIGISNHVISPGFAVSLFRVMHNRVYLHFPKKFPPNISGCLDSAPYEIFDPSEDDTLPQHVYNETYCGLLATVHYIRSSSFVDMEKWMCLQQACNSSYVLSIKALYTTSNGPTIVFTELVNSLPYAWLTKMKREQIPLVDLVTGYITPSLCSIYMDILTSMIHVLNDIDECHENVTLDNIWLRNGSTVLGYPKYSETEVMGLAERDTDTKMFKRVVEIIHDDLLPKELDFFCRILHNDVATEAKVQAEAYGRKNRPHVPRL